ncbi:hypothetical protein ACJIZ3_010581 [Penstemon smallii]|uniref:BED-type domain-containing protein n=1 Tax=Penstemon smallii TaxID=265156 RepID=A0ABD3UGQ1_9LAMI
MEISEEAVIVNTSRLKSVVWNDFDRVKKGETFVAICRHCKRVLSGSSRSGTSHLRNHLIRCRRRSNHDVTQLLTRGKKKQSTISLANFSYNQVPIKDEIVTVANMVNAGSFDFDHRRSQVDLACLIIMHGYPLDMVEDTRFKKLVRNIQPLFDLSTVIGVEVDCMDIYRKEKQMVYKKLDILPGMVSLSADRWATYNGDTNYLCLKILNFLPVNNSQAEDLLSEIIMTIVSLTIDYGSTYDTIISRIRDQLYQQRFLMCKGLLLFDVRYVLETSLGITNKVRETIQFVKSSRATQEKIDEIVQLVGINCPKWLSLDNPLQWNSTFFMLKSALDSFMIFFILFFIFIFIFISNMHITANSYFAEICDIHLQLIEWSVILDPRFKMKLVNYYYPQIYANNAPDCINTVSNCMKAPFNGHAIYSPLAANGSASESSSGRFLHENSLSHNTESDLEEPLFPRSVDFGILNWWKVHEPRYPVLSMMARNILGIPISKAVPESLLIIVGAH